MNNKFSTSLCSYSATQGEHLCLATTTPWIEYDLVINATTTAPSYGSTIIRNKAQWRRIGNMMELRYDFQQAAAGAAGSGTYLFPLPAGFTMDATSIPLDATINNLGIVGTGAVSTASDYSASGRMAHIAAYNATNLMIYIDVSGTFGSVTSASSELANANQMYYFNARVPIVGWSE